MNYPEPDPFQVEEDKEVSFLSFLNQPGLNRFLGRLFYGGIGFILVSIIYRIMAGDGELVDIVNLYINGMLIWGLACFIVGGTVGFILYRRMIDRKYAIGNQVDE